jgi:hypothetical protein
MAESWLRSYAIDAPDPVPWGWNPAATFQTAFNDAQAEKRAQEKMALENELAQILLPQKRAEAEFNLKKLAYDTERLTLVNRLQTEDIEERRRILRSGGLGGGQGGGGGGNNAPATNAQQPDPTIIDTSNVNFRSNTPKTPPPGGLIQLP